MAQEPDDGDPVDRTPIGSDPNPIGRVGKKRARLARGVARGWGPAYQGAMEASLAVAISVGIGIWVDSELETSPYGMLIGLGVGFASFVVRLVRLVRELSPPAAGIDADSQSDAGPGPPSGTSPGGSQDRSSEWDDGDER